MKRVTIILLLLIGVEIQAQTYKYADCQESINYLLIDYVALNKAKTVDKIEVAITDSTLTTIFGEFRITKKENNTMIITDEEEFYIVVITNTQMKITSLNDENHFYTLK